MLLTSSYIPSSKVFFFFTAFKVSLFIQFSFKASVWEKFILSPLRNAGIGSSNHIQ
jgi:hypothetical protein